jgi:hypothetical protein
MLGSAPFLPDEAAAAQFLSLIHDSLVCSRISDSVDEFRIIFVIFQIMLIDSAMRKNKLISQHKATVATVTKTGILLIF